MQYLDGIIKRKQQQKNPQGQPSGSNEEKNAVIRIAEYHPEFRKIVAPTYMALVYQEQIMQVFRTLAGYSMGGADLVRLAMGHKIMDVLAAEKKAFIYGDPSRNISGAINNGVTEKDAEDLFEEMIEFAKYSFNKSHAAAYAYTAYITAYLKYHFPAEYYAAVLSMVDEHKQYQPLIAEAKQMGITVCGPDINLSVDGFGCQDRTVRFGFSAIKGGGSVMDDVIVHRTENGKYKDFSDFIMREEVSEKTVENLIKVGCFDSFGIRRASLSLALDDFYFFKDKIKKRKADLEKAKGMLADLQAGIPLDRNKWKITTKCLPTEQKLQANILKYENDIEEYKDGMECITFSESLPVDKEKELNEEKDLLGVYVSGHHLQLYGTAQDHGVCSVKHPGPRTYGMITNVRYMKTKAEEKPMAAFTLEDDTDSIEVVAFPDSFAKNREDIQEGKIVIIQGTVKDKKMQNQEVRPSSDGEGQEVQVAETQSQIVLSKDEHAIEPISKMVRNLNFEVASEQYIAPAMNALREFEDHHPDDNSCKVTIFVMSSGDIASAGFVVRPEAEDICDIHYAMK